MSGVGKGTVLLLVSMLFVLASVPYIHAETQSGCPDVTGELSHTSGTLEINLDLDEYLPCALSTFGITNRNELWIEWAVTVAGITYYGNEFEYSDTVSSYNINTYPEIDIQVTVLDVDTWLGGEASRLDRINQQMSIIPVESEVGSCEDYMDEASCPSSCQWEGNIQGPITGTTCGTVQILNCDYIVRTPQALCGSDPVYSHSTAECACIPDDYYQDYLDDPEGFDLNNFYENELVVTSAYCGTGTCTSREPTCPGGTLNGVCCTAGVFHVENPDDGLTRICFDGIIYSESDRVVEFRSESDDVSAHVYDGQIHLCGEIPQEYVDSEGAALLAPYDLCGELSVRENRFTCAVESQDEDLRLVWSETAPYYDNPSDEWDYLLDRNLIPDEAVTFSPLACKDGQLDIGVLKYSPPPHFLPSAYVPENRCVNEAGQPAPEGTYSVQSSYICQTLGDSDVAEWAHVIARVADVSLSYARSDSIMNCGPAEFAANDRGASNFFCQVAHLRGDGSASTIITSLHIPSSSAPLIINNAITEMRLLGLQIPPGTDVESLSDSIDGVVLYDPTYFDDRGGILVFSITQPNPNLALRFFESIRNLFFSASPPENAVLISRSGEQYFVHIEDGEITRQAVVEWVQDEDTETFTRYIIRTDDEPIPYTAHDWRRVIQTR